MLQGNVITSVDPGWFRGLPPQLIPIISPNPLACTYATCPAGNCAAAAERLRCSSCSLCYAFANATGMCKWPDFGPDGRWDPAEQRSDFGGADLYTETTYSADAPPLAPANKRFVGYAGGRFDAITYRVEVGGAVDLECGTVATGNTSDAALHGNAQQVVNPEYRSDNANYGPEFLY